MVRYGAGIVDWRDRELKVMDVKTRKRLMMFGCSIRMGLHSEFVHEEEGSWKGIDQRV